MKNFLIRIAIAIPLAGLFIFCNVFDALGRIPFLMFVGILMHLMLKELLDLAPLKLILKADKIIAHGTLLLLLLVSWLPLYRLDKQTAFIPTAIHEYLLQLNTEATIFFAIIYLFVVLMSTNILLSGRFENSLFRIAIPVFSIVYLVSLFYCYTQLLIIDLYYVVLVTVGTFVGDTTMLLGGKLFGKHPIGKGASPFKTWEGYIIGIPGTFLTVWLTVFFYRKFATQTPHQEFSSLVISSLLIYIFTILGDLIESSFKRGAHVKDSGRLPGHGGFLDMLDSISLTVPAMWLWIYISTQNNGN